MSPDLFYTTVAYAQQCVIRRSPVQFFLIIVDTLRGEKDAVLQVDTSHRKVKEHNQSFPYIVNIIGYCGHLRRWLPLASAILWDQTQESYAKMYFHLFMLFGLGTVCGWGDEWCECPPLLTGPNPWIAITLLDALF